MLLGPGSQSHPKRGVVSGHQGGLNDFGSDLSKEIPLGMHRKMPDNATIHEAKDRAVELRDSQTSDLYQRERKRVGDPAVGRRSDQVSFEAKRLRVCIECNVCRLSSRNLDRVVCGAPSEDVEYGATTGSK